MEATPTSPQCERSHAPAAAPAGLSGPPAATCSLAPLGGGRSFENIGSRLQCFLGKPIRREVQHVFQAFRIYVYVRTRIHGLWGKGPSDRQY